MTGPLPFPSMYLDEVVSPSAVHPTEFYSLTDPALDEANHVTAGKRWRKTDNLATPSWFEVYVRNEANDAWILERAWVNDTFAVGEVPVADSEGRLAPGTVTPGAHASDHENGGTDEIDVAGLSGELADAQKVEVSAEGSSVGTRPEINFVEGSNVTITVTDNGGANRVDVEIESTGGGGLSDGDYGDITVGGSGTTLTIDSGAVSYAKIQDVSAASKLLGRGSAGGSGDVEEISVGTGLSMSGTTLSATAGSVWTLAVDEDGSSFANFTSVAGTWASSGGVITQTDTGNAKHAYYTAQVANARCVIKAKVKMVTGNDASSSRVGLILGYNQTATGCSIVYLEGSTTAFTRVRVEQGATAVISSTNTTPAYGTFHDLLIDQAGNAGSVYVNGTLMLTYRNESNSNSQRDSRYIGLYTNQASAAFDDIKVYTMTLP